MWELKITLGALICWSGREPWGAAFMELKKALGNVMFLEAEESPGGAMIWRFKNALRVLFLGG